MTKPNSIVAALALTLIAAAPAWAGQDAGDSPRPEPVEGLYFSTGSCSEAEAAPSDAPSLTDQNPSLGVDQFCKVERESFGMKWRPAQGADSYVTIVAEASSGSWRIMEVLESYDNRVDLQLPDSQPAFYAVAVVSRNQAGYSAPSPFTVIRLQRPEPEEPATAETAEETIARLEAEIVELNSDVEELEADLAAEQETVEMVSEENAALQVEVARLQQSVDVLLMLNRGLRLRIRSLLDENAALEEALAEATQ